MEDIRLQPVNQMQQVQAAGQENLPKEQQEKLPAYSERYYDDYFEYRHVSLTMEQAQRLPKPMRILAEVEWRTLGVQQSKGWVHYAVHRPEPHVLLFRRPKFYGTDKEVVVPRSLLEPANQNMPMN
eukprot:jgi/Ulvmu1/1496/UM011_0226.1